MHGSVQVAEAASEMDGDQKKFSNYSYPAMTKTQGSFQLSVEAGEFTDSEILVMLGENGTGGLQRLRCLALQCCGCMAAHWSFSRQHEAICQKGSLNCKFRIASAVQLSPCESNMKIG